VKIPLNSGAYQNRSLIANAQRSVNTYCENNPEESDPESPFTHYVRPGNRPLGAPPVPGRGRGVFRVSNGDLYGVAGPNVYYIDKNWNFNQIGVIQNQFTPVSMDDNGQSNGNEIVLVDNSPLGYQINMTSRQMTQIVDTTGLFSGSTRVTFFDTFFFFNEIGTNNFYCSLSEQVAFNALDQASKGTFGDPIQAIIACQRTLWPVGTMTAEPWFNAGDPIFPLEEVFGQIVPHGTIAPFSVWTQDVNAGWLDQNKDGRAIMIMIEGYGAKRISTYALEDEWLTYPTRSDAICYTYQQGGHSFVVIHFPSANKSWGYDRATGQWHERAYTDQNGKLNRERVAFHAFAYDTNVGMDWATGQIYALDPNYMFDNGQPISCIRSFPHVVNEMHQITVPCFTADMATGILPGSSELPQISSPWSSGFGTALPPIVLTPAPGWTVTPGQETGIGRNLSWGPQVKMGPPQIALRVSKNGGETFGNYRFKELASAGHYRSMLRWRGLGQGRDWVFELSWVAGMTTGLNQAFLDTPIVHGA
jgi:hypothetical protein